MAALYAPTSQGFCCAVICITELLLVCTTAMLFIKMILTLTPCLMYMTKQVTDNMGAINDGAK